MTNTKREIKFRIWNKNNKKMFYEPQIMEWHVGDSLNNYFKVDDVIFQQFTGLTDKNGNEVYEGDILKHSNPTRIYEVRWDNVKATFNIFRCGNEVIGNIYENSNLLQ